MPDPEDKLAIVKWPQKMIEKRRRGRKTRAPKGNKADLKGNDEVRLELWNDTEDKWKLVDQMQK